VTGEKGNNEFGERLSAI